MSTESQRTQHRLYSAAEWNALHDEARSAAQALRREAIRDFWRGADTVWAAGLDTAQRSARRLAHSLARHAQARAAANPPCKEC